MFFYSNFIAIKPFVINRTIKVDDFTRRLWNIYTTVREEGQAQVRSWYSVTSICSIFKG